MRSFEKKTIAILIGGHLSNAPRVQKEAAALRKQGAKIHVFGTWWSETLAAEDLAISKHLDINFSAVVNYCEKKNLIIRVKQKFSQILFSRFGIAVPRIFGLGAPELLKASSNLRADFTMVHSEAGLWVAKKLLQEGFSVGVDFEDWFSQDLSDADRNSRPVVQMQALERYLLNKAHCCFATTQAMAVALANDSGTSSIPTVIPNCFPSSGRLDAMGRTGDVRPTNQVSFYWFSQTIGPGRGLEALARALPLLHGEWQLSIRGDLRGYGDWFNENFPQNLRERIKLLDIVPNAELLARTMSHDVGLALEIPFCPSRDLTATNKIFEYLRAGIAVIATNTAGQHEVMRACPEAGEVVKADNAESLAAAMQKIIDNPKLLSERKISSMHAGEVTWSWEQYEQSLIDAIVAGVSNTNVSMRNLRTRKNS